MHSILLAVYVTYTVLVKANKEVLVCTGAIDTPKLLLLSGIGPSEELAKHNIPCVHELPGIGKHLLDRLFVPLASIQKPGSHHRTSYIASPQILEEVRKPWLENQSGPLGGFFLPQVIGFFRSPGVFNSKEFRELDIASQDALFAETKPSFEIISVSLHSHLYLFFVSAGHPNKSYLLDPA